MYESHRNMNVIISNGYYNTNNIFTTVHISRYYIKITLMTVAMILRAESRCLTNRIVRQIAMLTTAYTTKE